MVIPIIPGQPFIVIPSGGGAGRLLAANNLSDVANAAASATNLGLGTGDSPTFSTLNLSGDSEIVIQFAGTNIQSYGSSLSIVAAGTLALGEGNAVNLYATGVQLSVVSTGVTITKALTLTNTTTPTAPSSAANIMSLSGVLSGQNDGESAALKVSRSLQGSGTWSSGSLPANSVQTQNFFLTGINVGSPVIPGYTSDLQTLLLNPLVSIAFIVNTSGTATCIIRNASLINAFDPTGFVFNFTGFQ